jgi:heme exporter protein A
MDDSCADWLRFAAYAKPCDPTQAVEFHAVTMPDSLNSTIPPLIAAEALRFQRGEEPIFGPMNFAVRSGEVLMLEGSNGSGKTSLLRVLAGLLEPSSGQVLREGLPVHADSAPLIFVSHSGGFKHDLSARENLRFGTRLRGLRPGTSIGSSLKSVGLEGFEDTPLRFLSAGQRKRAILAGVLITPAPLWLLDEPYANLDRHGHTLVDRLLETHAARGGAAVITSHGLSNPAVSKLQRATMECVAMEIGNA